MTKKIINILLILGMIVLTTMVAVLWHQSKRLGYINTVKLFDAFAYKKEIEKEIEKVQLVRQSYLDSLKLKIQSASIQINSNDRARMEEIEEYKKAYLVKEEEYMKQSEQMLSNYNEKIWKQLNQYMEDFGKETGYDYLFGTTTQGNIMYAGAEEDATDAAIAFVNARYNGSMKK